MSRHDRKLPRILANQSRLSLEKAREILSYDPVTGRFHWNVGRSPKTRQGDPAGYVQNPSGYTYIEINGTAYHAARLAWLLATGSWPSLFIDHKDGDRANNRLDNLREATATENARNVRLGARTSSGLKGASWYGPNGKWAAKIRVNGRLLHLGYFATPQEAHEAYVKAALHHFGDFMRAA